MKTSRGQFFPPMARGLFLIVMMAVAGSIARVDRTPQLTTIVTPDLDAVLPEHFTEWTRVPLQAAILPPELELGDGEVVAYRAFRNDLGQVVTLVAAYGPPLGDSVRLHRPELCYRAQGFVVENQSREKLQAAYFDVEYVHMETHTDLRQEGVSYWLRDGASYATNKAEHALLDLKRGQDVGADGALIRVSSRGNGARVQALHNDFMVDFINALDTDGQAIFLAPAKRNETAS